MARKPPPNKYQWTNRTLQQVKTHFYQVSTLQELIHVIKWKQSATLLRSKCYELGLKRMEPEYWTPVQVRYLQTHFRTIGDREMATIFNLRWPKGKTWTCKHIEKKRRYLHLKRTASQLKRIHQRNVQKGCFKICPLKRWLKTSVFPEGTIRIWKTCTGHSYPVIKIRGRFRHWGRWTWEKEYGQIPPGMNVVFKDGNYRHQDISNLELLSNADLAKRNSFKSSQGLSDNYIAGILSHGNAEQRKWLRTQPHLLELKRQSLTLNRIIYEQQIS